MSERPNQSVERMSLRAIAHFYRSASDHTMRMRHTKSAAFVNVATIELLAVVLGLSLLSVLILGSWPARIFALTAVGGFSAWSCWFDWWIRFRPGDRVQVKIGPRQGARGTVVEPLHKGRGARVELVVGEHTEIVDFHGGYELQKL